MSTSRKSRQCPSVSDRDRALRLHPKTVYALVLSMIVFGSFFADSLHAESFPSPVRITQTSSGDVWVADSKRQALVQVGSNPKDKYTVLSVPGRPVSVAHGWGKFFVGNEVTQSVDVLNKKGRLLFILGGKRFHIARPSDIAIDEELGLIFVSDSATARIWVFDQEGELLRTLPAAGETPLYRPTGLAVDPGRGEVLVSDFGDRLDPTATVSIYDYEGVFKTSIDGSAGCNSFGCVGSFNFSRPQGLTVDSTGLIYLVDSVLGQVLVFDRETLEGVGTIGEIGSGPGQLMLPLDLIIDKKTGDLQVTDNRNRRLEVFSGEGLLP
jgi:DNA-binding beta-propeller fold protein YncE